MILPYPFTRAIFICGHPIYVAPDSSDQQLQDKCRELEQELNRITSLADHYF
jgi:lysophospholipid acyltransferase (LPLAT)-like uncharacterized protein